MADKRLGLPDGIFETLNLGESSEGGRLEILDLAARLRDNMFARLGEENGQEESDLSAFAMALLDLPEESVMITLPSGDRASISLEGDIIIERDGVEFICDSRTGFIIKIISTEGRVYKSGDQIYDNNVVNLWLGYDEALFHPLLATIKQLNDNEDVFDCMESAGSGSLDRVLDRGVARFTDGRLADLNLANLDLDQVMVSLSEDQMEGFITAMNQGPEAVKAFLASLATDQQVGAEESTESDLLHVLRGGIQKGPRRSALKDFIAAADNS